MRLLFRKTQFYAGLEIEIAQYFRGQCANAANTNGETPLHQAVKSSQLRMVCHLTTTAGAYVEATLQGLSNTITTPLLSAGMLARIMVRQ
jgi:ankyrin repeat protein